MTRGPALRGTLLAAGLYVALTALLARDVLPHLRTRAIHDAVDPLLIAAILQWNATHVPLTHAWWQFPIFHPAPDALAFSEHLLGVSVIATPVLWVVGDPIVGANLTVLLTFPLCALAAFALARHLTGSGVAAFVAGLVYGFGPYRMAQLAHLQMLSVQWAPVAVLALHLYLETQRKRWLVLLGGAWLLQAASNGYALFFLSVFVGAWLLWFVILQRRWRILAHVVATLAVATAPLAPILWTYLAVHARNGFARGATEVAAFSADAAGALCAAYEVSVWGWLMAACTPEGQIFPGLVTAGLCVGGLLLLRQRDEPGTPVVKVMAAVRRLALAAAAVELAAALAVAVRGPWRLEWGPLSVHASDAARPFMIAAMGAMVAFALSPGVRASLRKAETLGFYLAAAGFMWWCALGPVPAAFGQPSDLPGPFALLMQLPGFGSLRVPARFWLMATLCLSVVAAFVVARLTERRTGMARVALVGVLSLGVLSDGWELHMPFGDVPPGPPDPATLRGERVLYLPVGDYRDVVPTYYSVVHGWTSVNGYSGFEPTHYDGVRQGGKLGLDGVFSLFRSTADLHVVVAEEDARLRALVERQPDVAVTARDSTAVQYRLARRSLPPPSALGDQVPVERATSSCPPAAVLVDRGLGDVWSCAPQMGNETITLVLRAPAEVAGVRLTLGRPVEFPRQLLVETSVDSEVWTIVRSGDVVSEFIQAADADPLRPALDLAFEPRIAGFVRLRQVGQDPAAAWSLREVEVLRSAIGR